MEKVYTRVAGRLDAGSLPAYLFIDLLEEMNLGDPVQHKCMEKLNNTLHDIRVTGNMSARDCCAIVRDENLYEFLQAKDVPVELFAITLAGYASSVYNLKIQGLPNSSEFATGDKQNLYNIIIKELICLFEVFL